MLQAQKCKFRDEREMEERIIDQIIARTKFPELQKQLLSKNKAMSTSEVLNTCRSYEASINHMRQMDELQGKCNNPISAIKHRLEDTDNWGKCGLNHKNGNCPARGSPCSACGRKNHWAIMCHNKKLKKKPPELYLRSGPGSGQFQENVFLFNGRPWKKVLSD